MVTGGAAGQDMLSLKGTPLVQGTKTGLFVAVGEIRIFMPEIYIGPDDFHVPFRREEAGNCLF